MSDDKQRHDDEQHDEAQEDLDLTELTEEDDESEYRSGDEIYQETRRDAGGVDTIDEDISNPDEISMSDSNPDTPFSEREEELRQFWRTRYAGRGKGFGYYRPALKYGYELSYDDNYDSDDWDEHEDDIRDRWEDTNPGTWDEMEPLIKHGWNMGYQFQNDVDIDNPMIEQGTSQQDAAIDEAEGDSAEDTGADQPENEHEDEPEEENA
jgi:hypothetical protein